MNISTIYWSIFYIYESWSTLSEYIKELKEKIGLRPITPAFVIITGEYKE